MYKICYVNNFVDGLFIFVVKNDVYKLYIIIFCKYCIVMYFCNGYVKYR